MINKGDFKAFDCMWIILNPHSIKVINDEQVVNIREDLKQIRKDQNIVFYDHNLDKDEWLQRINTSYIHWKLYSKIFNDFRKELDKDIYYWEPISGTRKTRKIYDKWSVFLSFADNKVLKWYQQVQNLCGYYEAIFSWLRHKLDELDYIYNYFSNSPWKEYEINEGEINIVNIHELNIHYNIFIANILSVIEFLDLFIVIKKILEWEEKVIVRTNDRSQRLNDYEIVQDFFYKIKWERDYLLHKWTASIRFLKTESNEIVIKMWNEFLERKVQSNYWELQRILEYFFTEYISQITK